MTADTCTECTVNYQEHTPVAVLLFYFLSHLGALLGVLFLPCDVTYTVLLSLREGCWTQE